MKWTKWGLNRLRQKLIICSHLTIGWKYLKFNQILLNNLQAKHISIGANFRFGKNRAGNPLSLKKLGERSGVEVNIVEIIEDNQGRMSSSRIRSALKENMKIIFCFGETSKEKKFKKTFSVIKNQINSSIKKNINLNNVLFAYEPVWSIGTGKILKTEELRKIFKFIKNQLTKKFKLKKSPMVLYGGSVNENNIGTFSVIHEIDGFLIGGASRSSKKFIDIIKNYYK